MREHACNGKSAIKQWLEPLGKRGWEVFAKVQWDEVTSADIVKVVSETFKITYKISGDSSCDYGPALAITAMLLNDIYRFPPDASIIQQTYDAASGELVLTPEPSPTP